MKMEHKNALADGSTCYDREGIFTVAELCTDDVGTDVEVGGRYELVHHENENIYAACRPKDSRKRGASLYWSQLAQEGAGGVLTKEHEWQLPKTKAEAAGRMMAGEVFCRKGRKLYFNGNVEGSPFRSSRLMDGSSASMATSWDSLAEFTQHIHEPKWDDNLSEQNPAWCWVWDGDEKRHRTVMEVIDKKGGRYITIFDDGSSGPWDNAEPCSQLAGVNSDE